MKNITLNSLILLFCLAVAALACSKKEEQSDLEKLRHNNNGKTYPVTKMDSAQAIGAITGQKAQELLDLAVLYNSGNGDTEIDSVIYAQMSGYILKPDSTKINAVLKPMDSLKAVSAKVNNLKVSKRITAKDTVDYANFNIDLFGSDRKKVGTLNRNASFILKQNPVKFKKEFKFYFLNLDYKLPKDSTSSGVTK